MARGLITKQMVFVCVLSLLLGMVFVLGGCGKKAEVVDDTTELPPTPAPDPTPVPPPPEPEDPDPMPEPDYGLMDPAEYGIMPVFFGFDEYTLSSDAMGILSDNARIMRDHTGLTWLVEGHCDERGTTEYNLALGEKRANAARDYLVSLGVPKAQLRTTSYGEEKPFESGSNERAWAQNRRAHFARP
ncbi:MAG: peptidoglycan-associated lipoprotein Pal [bacterium]